MMVTDLRLRGTHVRLDPLEARHALPLAQAAAADPSLYAWSMVPQGEVAMRSYIETALAWARDGHAIAFATVRQSDNTVIGSTRFFDLERWAWPPERPAVREGVFDGCEIGYTWLTRSAIRTAANSEAKLLMLTHAFEVWNVRRVCLHTDARNAISRAAIERIGGRFEGILRAHRLAADCTPRDSARFSLLASEWPHAKADLLQKIAPVA